MRTFVGVLSALLIGGSARAQVPAGRTPPAEQYSLWLEPSGAADDSVRRVVCELAQRYPSHCFNPHMTVVGDVAGSLDDITRRAKLLATRTPALEATLTTVGWHAGDFFRSFYVLIEETPPLSKLYRDTCEIVGRCQTRPFHMSLMYTDQLSDSARAAIRDSLYAIRGGSGFGTTLRLDRLTVCASAGLPPERWTCPVSIDLRP